MIKKCVGCGAILQYDKPELAGYIESDVYEKANLCRRCFRIKCYGDYVFIKKEDDEYIKLLNDINQTNDLILYLADIFNLNDSLNNIHKYLNNPLILVVTKSDLLPYSVKKDTIVKWLEQYHLNAIDIVFVSSQKKDGLDALYNSIKRNKKSNRVYIVGNTNTGKSTLINQLLKYYSGKEANITTSILPSTTLEKMEIELNSETTLVDTPGLIDEGNIINTVDYLNLKKIVPKKEIKPRIYQFNDEQSLVLEDFARIDYVKGQYNSFVIYASNEIKVERINYRNNERVHKLKKITIETTGNEDIVINGLGWIKVIKPAIIDIYTSDKVSVFKRSSLL